MYRKQLYFSNRTASLSFKLIYSLQMESNE